MSEDKFKPNIRCESKDDKVECSIELDKIPKRIAWASQVIEFKNKDQAIKWANEFYSLVLSGATSPDSVVVLEYF